MRLDFSEGASFHFEHKALQNILREEDKLHLLKKECLSEGDPIWRYYWGVENVNRPQYWNKVKATFEG